MAAEDNKPYVTSFLGKKKITSSEFITIFQKYDKDGESFRHVHMQLRALSQLVAVATPQNHLHVPTRFSCVNEAELENLTLLAFA